MSQPNPLPLLPCPWCGSEKIRLELGDNCDHFVYCDDCAGTGPAFVETDGHNGERAIAAWNKGPYADREEAHAAALKSHAERLCAEAEKHRLKAAELEQKALGLSSPLPAGTLISKQAEEGA